MTAAGCDYVSEGRFILGLGASGPQVIEGFHGVPYDKPMQRIKEYRSKCSAVSSIASSQQLPDRSIQPQGFLAPERWSGMFPVGRGA